MNIIAFIPAALLGVIGGILGAIFTFINLKIARARKRLLAKVSKQRHQQVIRMLEPITIMVRDRNPLQISYIITCNRLEEKEQQISSLKPNTDICL